LVDLDFDDVVVVVVTGYIYGDIFKTFTVVNQNGRKHFRNTS
jgi:hypothetical protein